MAGSRFRLFSSDGDELGEFVMAAPDWNVGDEFIDADRREWRIVDMIGVDDRDSPYRALFQVKPA